jgi:hypothetical protein
MLRTNKTNIKTITCHDVYNHGASLQAYALQRYLEELGCNVEIIDYKPDYLSNHYRLTCISNPKFDKPIIKWLYILAKLPGRLHALSRKRVFDTFRKKYLKTTLCRYRSNEELKNNLPPADIYICGSDQIWNSFFLNGSDPAFYLDFVPDNCFKMSYAASFATDDINESLKSFVKEKLERLNAVSVRETSGLSILKHLEIGHAVQVMDPVFLLPALFWKQEFVKPIADNYVFVYDFDKNPLVNRLSKNIAQNLHCKIFSVSENISYSDKNFWKEGPEMFLSLLYNAECIVSNSFHALAFSLIFEKPFFTIYRKESINTRMRDLLKMFDLEHRIINETMDWERSKDIDYSKITPLINKEIEKSQLFIKKSIR